jgi:hypothetical protein
MGAGRCRPRRSRCDPSGWLISGHAAVPQTPTATFWVAVGFSGNASSRDHDIFTGCHRAWTARPLHRKGAADRVNPGGGKGKPCLSTKGKDRNASSRRAGPNISRVVAGREVASVDPIDTDTRAEDRAVVDGADGGLTDRALRLDRARTDQGGRQHKEQGEEKCFCFHFTFRILR